MKYRIEKDTMGEVKVPSDKYWGAQTERSRNNFKIGAAASMPLEVVYGFAYLKKAAAHTNCELGVLSENKRDLISLALVEVKVSVSNVVFPSFNMNTSLSPTCVFVTSFTTHSFVNIIRARFRFSHVFSNLINRGWLLLI